MGIFAKAIVSLSVSFGIVALSAFGAGQLIDDDMSNVSADESMVSTTSKYHSVKVQFT